jgi:hypothetical protein
LLFHDIPYGLLLVLSEKRRPASRWNARLMGSFQAREAASRSIEIGHVFLVAAVPLAGANCQRETIVTQLARLRQWDFLEKCGE